MHKVFIFAFVIAVSLSAIGAQAESYKRNLREYVEGSVLMLVIIITMLVTIYGHISYINMIFIFLNYSIDFNWIRTDL